MGVEVSFCGLFDSTGDLGDFADTRGLGDFQKWPETQATPIANFARLGYTEEPEALAFALRGAKAPDHVETMREDLLACAEKAKDILIVSEEPLDEEASSEDEQFGQPVVPNGIPLSKIHHAAFDAHLIGIDPDYRLHVAERLLVQNDGPMLEALKRLNGGTIHLPNRTKDHPDRDRLSLRFERFKAAA